MLTEQNSEPNSGLVVQFHWGVIEDTSDDTKQKKLGYRVYRDVPWCRIMIPAERDVYDQPVIHEDDHPNSPKNRFPLQWARFQAGQSQEDIGMPLAEWPQILRSQAETLAGMKIKTLEALASVSDAGLINLGPGYMALRQKARDYIKKAKEDAPFEQIREEMAAKDNELAILKAQMAELLNARMPAPSFAQYEQQRMGQQLAQPMPVATPAPKPKRKRGRPAKAEAKTGE